jgi:hypothetical protein
LKGRIPTKIVTVVAPASEYFLPGYDIVALSEAADWIIFETYDYYSNTLDGVNFAQPGDGCPAGDCLRASSNWTVTMNLL